jgi:Ca-activated chloride channel family protein
MHFDKSYQFNPSCTFLSKGKCFMKTHFWQILVLILFIPQWVLATGLQPIGTSTPVRVQAIDFDLEMRSIYVSGVMEVQFTADSGEENAANLRFPLPPKSVLYKAEIYLPSQEQWAIAETMGRKEGQIIYNQSVEQEFEPLLIQKIGTDFYRARIYPVTEQGDLRMRVYYAHTLETTANQYRLRIPFANPDSTAATPANGITISLQTDANAWTAGVWRINDEIATPSTANNDEMGTPATVNLDNGTALLNLEDFTMAQDVTLDLQPNESIPQATVLSYQPQVSDLPGHLHTWWQPDFSNYPKATSQPRNVVFVIDVSGSMSGAKMAQTRQAVIRCLEALSETDYYGIVAFDDEIYPFRPNMRSGADIDAAIEWVSDLDANGSTGMSAGLTTGAAIGIRSPLASATIDLLMITDGRPNEGSDTVEDILADVRTEADSLGRQLRIFSVGIGYDLDQSLLNGLTQQTGGESTFALDDNEITGQTLDLFARVRDGGISNVVATLQSAGFQDNALTWQRIFPGTALQLSAKGEIGPQITVNLTGELFDSTQLVLNIQASTLNFENTENASFSQIAAPLAAKIWTDALERQIDEKGETQELINPAIILARTYGIVTRYTSLLALESDKSYAKQSVERIARDPAGIALQPIETESIVDEGRIGGEGTSDDEDSNASLGQPQPLLTMAPPPPAAPPPPIFPQAMVSGGMGYSASSPYDSDFKPLPAIDCEAPILDGQLQLDIPRVLYQGNYYWASLQLNKLVDGALTLTVVNYGPVASPSFSICQADELVFSATLQLNIPLVLYEKEEITDVILQAIPTTDGHLEFEVVSYTA